ncbi:MAG: response regulator transcription factor [Lachnospiraceae bacterium]|nr:response regulator transcription factor [Lachnospiraceae bacterium]
MNILVAEDEEDLKDVIEAVLAANGYTVDVTENGAQMLEKANANEYAAIVSDIMMPVMDGITAVKKLRESGNDTPVLFLTAKTEVDDRINGLDAGADDYLTKPFAVGELLARVRAMTRRSRANTQKVISVYNITLDTEKEELTGQNSIRLPAKESHMLGFFMNNPEKDFSTEELIEKFWKNEENADEEAVWLYVSFLKNKLRAVGAAVTIEGEKGSSYRLAGTN